MFKACWFPGSKSGFVIVSRRIGITFHLHRFLVGLEWFGYMIIINVGPLGIRIQLDGDDHDLPWPERGGRVESQGANGG